MKSVAAIDCGTNSTRLLVADGEGTTLERRMSITRLGQGVDAGGCLSAEAIARTEGVLREYRQVMDRHSVGRIRATATSAARDASNREDFMTAVESAIGVRPELLSGQEEGRLSFMGATADLGEETGPWLVVDIGGGSTEFVVGNSSDRSGRRPLTVLSAQMGCVRVTERFLSEDPPSRGSMEAAEAFAVDQVRQAALAHQEFAKARVMIGLAGTVSATSRLLQGLETYSRDLVHHSTIGGDQVIALRDRLATLSVAQRKQVKGMEAARADVLVGGLTVLAAVMTVLDFDRCLVSESDILDGLVGSII